MRRREFVALLGGAATWPLAAHAQQTTKLPTIGFLGGSIPTLYAPWVNAFVERLRAHDWIEGRTVSIEYRWAEGSYERAAEIAAEFVRTKVDVIVTAATPVCLQQRKRHQKSRLSLRQPAIRLVAALSQALRDRAAMSLVCQSRRSK